MITVHVLFFATIREIIGEKEKEIQLPEGATVQDLKEKIITQYPHAERPMETMLASVDHVFSDEETVLEDGVEVAFFPHVSGGNFQRHKSNNQRSIENDV